MTLETSDSNQMDFQNWRKKALFLAKRGNLESELLLVAHIDRFDETISNEEKAHFELLLSENDQNLLCWLMKFNPKAPDETVIIPDEYQVLIDQIRANYLK